MKKIVIVRLDKACDPEVNSLEDVLELMCAPHADDTCKRECKSKKKSDETNLSEEALELISTIAKDLGIDVEQLKKDVIEEKYKADAKKAAEAEADKAKALFDKLEKIHGTAKAKEESENAAKSIKFKIDAAYTTGAIDGYEKGFKDAIKFISSRINKSFTATLSDLNDMAKWNFKDGTLKEDAVFKK